MQRRLFRRQIKSYWNSMGQLWWNALGLGLKRFLGPRSVESAKDFVWLTRYLTASEGLKF